MAVSLINLRRSPGMATTLSRTADAAMPLFIVHNAGSGSAQAGCLDTIRSVLGAAGRPYELLPGQGAGMDGVTRAAVALCRQHQGALIVAGGDGSISGAVQQALPAGVPLGVIPVGTFNYFARTHGIPLDVEAATRALLDAVPVPVQVGQVNDRYFTVNASFGLYAQSLEDREAFKQRFGRSRFVALLAGLATLLRPQEPWLVELDVAPALVRTSTVFVGNNMLQLQQTGIPGVEALVQGSLVAVIVRPADVLQRLATFLRGAAGKLWQAEAVECFAFHRLQVTPRLHHGARRLRVGIDGETVWLSTPLRFQRAAQPLQLLVPAAAVPDRDAA
jgi:diacylglycerol kinase family enzyme